MKHRQVSSLAHKNRPVPRAEHAKTKWTARRPLRGSPAPAKGAVDPGSMSAESGERGDVRAAPLRDDSGDEDHLNFEVDSFHATPIDIMLNAEKYAEDRSPVVPPPRCRRPWGTRRGLGTILKLGGGANVSRGPR